MSPQRKFITASRTTMSYQLSREAGPGELTIVLLHGFGASLDSWSDVYPGLSSEYPVLRLDLKGFGMSGKPEDNAYAIADQARFVVDGLRKLNLMKIVLVGHSYGGAVALVTYLLGSDSAWKLDIRALVFIDPAIYDQPLPFFISDLRNPARRFISNTFTTPEWRARYVLDHIFANKTQITDERVQRYAAFYDSPGSHYSFAKAAEQIVPANADSVRDAIPSIALPVLAITGELDTVVPVALTRRLALEAPSSSLKVIAGAGHVPHEEQPEETLTTLLRFLNGLQ